MSDQETADRSSKQEGEAQSLAELFHLVKTLIEDRSAQWKKVLRV